MRKTLKFKIIERYGSITNFSEVLGYSRTHISNVINKKIIGSNEFWEDVQTALELSDEQTLACIRDTKRENNKKRIDIHGK